jgi:LCP family protein required for cell wall assembly
MGTLLAVDRPLALLLFQSVVLLCLTIFFAAVTWSYAWLAASSSPVASWRWLRAVGIGLLLVLLLGVGYLQGSTALALFTIQQNFQAMQLPASTAPAASTPISTGITRTAALTLTGNMLPTPERTRPLTASQVFSPAVAHHPTSPLSVTRSATPTVVPPAGDAITILLLGSDQRPGETYPARTDTIIVAHIDPTQQRVALLSLPRDLIVEIPGYAWDRINVAHVYGELYGSSGVDVARSTVSNLLGIPIDHVVTVNFQGFIGAVDALGGVTINVERELYDPHYPTMDYGYMVAHFLPGEQHMDGSTALMYSRMRHMDSEFERMRRQQAVVRAMLRQVRDHHPPGQLQQVANLSTALRAYVQTDIPPRRMVGLAWALRDFDPASLERYVLDETMVTMGGYASDPYATIALPGRIEGLVHRLLAASSSPKPRSSANSRRQQ